MAPNLRTTEDSGLLAFLEAEASMRSVGARFLLAAGQAWDTRNLSHRHPAGPRGSCYRTAFELATKHPGELAYCEGRALSGLVPIEHAWCVDSRGAVVDTTWSAEARHYFGVCFELGWLTAWVDSRGFHSVLANFFPKELLSIDPAAFLWQPSEQQLQATRRLQAEVLAQLQGD